MMNSRAQKSLVESLLKTDFHSKVAAESVLRLNGKDYRLIGKHIRIGRAPDNDISIDNPSISRYHAMISLSADGYLIEDLKSRNGIRVNGSLIDKVILSGGDLIQVGDAEGEFIQKQKSSPKNEKPAAAAFQEEFSKSIKILGFRWKRARSKKKIVFLAMLVFPLLVFSLLFSGGKQLEENLGLNQVEAATAAVSYEMVSKEDFSRCIELEDLLNLKKARSCFQALPQTEEVREALSRVITRQEDLSLRRYQEGEAAFKNYYFDAAIQKWQEVLLVADEDSDFLSKARLGMETAEQRKLLR